MINNNKVLAIIPARGGSKGVPRKNILPLAGKPLIAWTIEEAKKSKYIDRVILSSEDAEIIQIAKKYGCDVPFVRPAELAQDTTSGIEPILHALKELPGYDYVVLLQPTAPLRLVNDIDKCIELMIEKEAPASVSVVASEISPHWMYTLNAFGEMQSFIDQEEVILRRQELPVVYHLNGAVYVSEVNYFKQKKSFLTSEAVAYIMPRERSLDIDTEMEFDFCDLMLKRRLF